MNLGNRLKEDEEVLVTSVMKNNSVVLEGISILRKGVDITPNIYMNSYYQEYLKGVGMEVVTEEIWKIYNIHCETEELVVPEFNFTFEEMRSSIIYRIINYDKNLKLLNESPHIRFLDLAITFQCLVRNEQDGIGTIRITNEYMEQWAVNTKTLFQLANENTQKIFPPVIRSIEDVIEEMQEDVNYPFRVAAGEEITPCPMYILSNQKGINGAAALLYSNVIAQFADCMNSDLFVLPSSIHEVILVPYNKYYGRELFEDMVKDVNLEFVPIEDILSDRVYLYKRETNSFEM